MNSYTPAIAKIKKKKIKIIIVLIRYGKAENKVIKSTLRARIVEIVLSGLNTRRDLRLDRFTPSLLIIKGIKDVVTIVKSRQFQPSLKYAFFVKRNPIPKIFKPHSMEYA
jgi:hypothetical protein